jgi:TRAP-type C4-dicarboxylate transport system permease small subunit
MRRLEKFVDAFGALCLGLLLALMVAQVVMRYCFHYTPFFTEEIGRYLLVWSALAGTALAVRQRGHIRIEFLLVLLPERARRWWLAALDAWCLLLFAFIAVSGAEMAWFARNQTSQGMQIPLVWPYAGVTIFFVLAAAFALFNLLPQRRSNETTPTR